MKTRAGAGASGQGRLRARRHGSLRLLSGLLLGLVLAGSAAVGDQTEPGLDALFERLRATDDPARGDRITAEIWSLWHRTTDPAVADAMEQGAIALERGRHARAERIYSRVIAHAPDFAEAWNKRATARYLLGETAAAAADIRRTLVLEPRHFGALAGLGLVYMRLERYRAAIGAFERALEINPHLDGTRRNIVIARERLRAGST